MSFEIGALLVSLGAVVLAEMGDKTQLLAMAFATKYKAPKVLIGVFVATVLNHGLAVLVGNLIVHLESAQIWIQGISSLSFIFFGLWTIRGDKLEEEENKKTKYGPIITVALAFFVAEMGDKTQLATVALATKFPLSPLAVLAGTTAGMMVADGLGILIGVVMAKKIPERVVKLVSAGAFIVFGFIGTYEVIHSSLKMDYLMTAIILSGILIVTCVIACWLIKRNAASSPKTGSTPSSDVAVGDTNNGHMNINK
jgi:putative Ca2+/H+ antiporter (TMEM165/GDT1 family)